MKNVSLNGKMGPQGYIPENDEHWDVLVDERGIGRDPLLIPVDDLTAAGHGRRQTSAVVAAMGDVPMRERPRKYKDLRGYCVSECAETKPVVRRCAIIDCPIWPYRMGKNPHNPKRGTNPFASNRDA